MSSWDGKRSVRLTRTQAPREHAPRWSPNGRYLAFLSSRDDPREVEQVWLLDRNGGEAERLTDLPGGVSDYAWSPDGTRLALIASDPDPDRPAPGTGHHQEAAPRRSWWTATGSSTTRSATSARSGSTSTSSPSPTARPSSSRRAPTTRQAPSWSPDGRSIAFLSRRRPEYDRTDNWDVYVVAATPGAEPRQLTTFTGADMDPEWGSRAPSWSPDGKLIAYVQGGKPELLYYGGQKVAVVPVDGGPGPGPHRRRSTGTCCRRPSRPTARRSSSSWRTTGSITSRGCPPRAARSSGWSRASARSRISPSAGTAASRVASSTPRRSPPRCSRSTARELRQVSAPERRLARRRCALAPVEEISFKSRDGTTIHGFMLKPPDYRRGHPLSHDPPDPRRAGVAVLPRLRQSRLAGARGAAATSSSA